MKRKLEIALCFAALLGFFFCMILTGVIMSVEAFGVGMLLFLAFAYLLYDIARKS